MFVPLVLPECLRSTAIREPVCVHEVEQIGLASRSEDISNVGVLRC